MVSIVKHANKKEKLAVSQQSWNKTVKLLIAKLIVFKRAINADSDFKLHKKDSPDPFPIEFNTYLANIIDDYDDVIKGADLIIDLQNNFHKTSHYTNESEKNATMVDDKDLLTVQSSWIGSRAWAWFALYKLGKEARRIRLRMMNIIHKSIYALNTIEYNFISNSPGSDVRAIVGLTKFVNLYIGGYLSRLSQLRESDLKGLEGVDIPKLDSATPNITPELDTIIDADKTTDTTEDIDKTQSNIQDYVEAIRVQVLGGILSDRVGRITKSTYDNNLKTVITTQFNRLKDAFYSDESGNRNKSDDEIVDIYYDLMKHIETAENNIHVKGVLFEEDEYRKIAQKAIRRWFGRKTLTWHGDKTDELKLQISDEIRDTVRVFRELLNYIESLDRSTADIEDKTLEASMLLKSVAEFTITFANDYRMGWRLEEDPKKRPAKLEENITSKLKKMVNML